METPPREDAAANAARLASAAATLYAETRDDSSACVFVCVSDTHSLHDALSPLPQGDVLLHAGDFTMRGELEEVQRFAEWWHGQPHPQKVVIAGNHDFCLEAEAGGHDPQAEELRAAAEQALSGNGSHYLHQATVVTRRGGFTVFGSAFQPAFWGAFNLSRRGRGLAEAWAAIPAGTDVVLTHGPAAGHGDFVPSKREHVGCEDLLRELLCRVRPAVAVAGHVHEGHGVSWEAFRNQGRPTAFVNAANCNTHYEATQPPIVFALRRGADGVVTATFAGYEPSPALHMRFDDSGDDEQAGDT